MSTYNRGSLLGDAVRSVLAQDGATTPPFELLVVDNNSTDDTPAIARQFERVDSRVRYVREPRQGLSYARNAGIAHARAPLVAFTDDDVRADGGWVAAIVRAFDEHPEADVVGGRVLPRWAAPPPDWLTRDHWTPLALADYGDTAVAVTTENPICLVGANFAFRRGVFDAVGLFAVDLQRVKDGIGSLEDHEFLLRMLRVGRRGVYDPRIVVHADVQEDRLTREYHRRWHAGHGHFHALLRSEHMEQTRLGTLRGVPAHLYRQALGDVIGLARAYARRAPDRAFYHEVRLRFFRGFFRTRRHEFLQRSRRERRDELWRFLRGAFPRRLPLGQHPDTTVGQGHG